MSAFVDHIESTLLDLVDFPKSYAALDLPIQELKEGIKQQLNLDNLELRFKRPKIEKNTDFTTSCFVIELKTALNGNLFFCLPNEHLKTLVEILSKKKIDILDPDLAKSIFYTLTLESLNIMHTTQFLEDLNFKLVTHASTIIPPVFNYEITATINKQELHFYLIYSKEFALSFDRFIEPNLQSKIPKEFENTIDCTLNLQVGSVDLYLNEFKSIKKGDFVVLDRCTIDPETTHGTLSFMLDKRPLFVGKLKEDKVKILDMLEIQGEMMNEDKIEPEEENWVENPEIPEQATSETMENEIEEAIGTAGEKKVEKSKEALIKSEDIPLTMSVEVGRINMSVKELLNLTPDQTLDLKIDVTKGVDCLIGNKRVAKGELVKLGDFLGVRITEIRR
ncbi:MAG: Flagellar motor switch protein FliN [Chlamydiae bacterium]|nr:Flagellar motor switch protein FliN [Chlamydiota bacterium]